MSNYWSYDDVDEVHGSSEREVPCPAHCRGGVVIVQGQETDCIECEGFGSVLV